MEKMAVLEWFYCRQCNRKFIDYGEGCPSCLDYLYCQSFEEKVFHFSAEKVGGYRKEVIEMNEENGNGTLSRTCYLNGWKRVGLELEEVKAIEEGVRQRNIGILRESLIDSFKAVPTTPFFEGNARAGLVVALFEARRIHIYTAMKEALDTKVFGLKARAREEREVKASPPSQ